MARGGGRVYLHVGLPKTGTTFLQGVLSSSRRLLRDHGVLFPWPTGSHFWAAQDLTEHLFLGQPNPRVPGSWRKLARKARRWSPTTVLSHELFTLADAAQVRRAVADLEPAELHIVLTVRDFERQLPAVWQERLKNGGSVSFERHFAQAVQHEPSRSSAPAGFWRQQDAVGILARWSEVVPRERIHVITVPQPGAPRDTLWRRFSQVVGFDADLVDLTTVDTKGNVSLRPPQARLLRRVNARVHESLPPGVHRSVVKSYLTELAPAGQGSATTYGLSDTQRAVARRWSEELRQALTSGGYDVVGDPAELITAAPADQGVPLDDVPPEEEAAAAVTTAAALVRWLADPPESGRTGRLQALARHVSGRG